MLLTDKHTPRLLEELTCGPETTEVLLQLAKLGEIPHVLFHGPPGAGKATRINALLRALFGDSIDKTKAESITPDGGTGTDFTCLSSAYHNQIHAGELGTKDRHVVQHIVKQLASQMPASVFSGKKDVPKFRVFVIYEAECLSFGAQASLRRTLEKFVTNARVFFHVSRLSSIIGPLRSRCLNVRVGAPTDVEVMAVVHSVLEKEQLPGVPQDVLDRIVGISNGNLRQAVLRLEQVILDGQRGAKEIRIPWEKTCDDLAQKIMTTQTPKALLQFREGSYDMLTVGIPGELIIETVTDSLLKLIPETQQNLRLQIVRVGAHYVYNLRCGTKPAWHIEAFAAQTMHFVLLSKS